METPLMASILTVDDSASMRQMVAYTLKSAGHEVTEAKDGIEALEKARRAKFNLVITDVNMPNMDGITLTRELRALMEYKYTPILTLTTESGNSKKQEGKAAGATGWIIKPFNPDQLLSTIKKVLG
jgi:two-component system chemotaxis response regulator CheY